MTTDEPSMLSVYDGQVCTGFVLSRGPSGFEGFVAGQDYTREHSVGLFRTAPEAADAITAARKGIADDR
jgi:hypothetical protein